MSDRTSESSANYIVLTRLADEFAARYRAGQRPPLQEYIDRYPELADDIRELFPAMVEIEQVREDHPEAAARGGAPPAPALQQLGDFRSLMIWNIPRIRAQLAQIGLDWQDAPLLPAASSEPAEAGSEARPLETARLFVLELFGTAQATLAALANVCRVDIAAVDGTNWHARITKLFDDPQAGATYTVRFRANADAPRRIWLGALIDEPDYHPIGLGQDVPLTEAWQDYQYQFQAKDPAAENSIQFNVGDQTGTVWIADFTLTKGAK